MINLAGVLAWTFLLQTASDPSIPTLQMRGIEDSNRAGLEIQSPVPYPEGSRLQITFHRIALQYDPVSDSLLPIHLEPPAERRGVVERGHLLLRHALPSPGRYLCTVTYESPPGTSTASPELPRTIGAECDAGSSAILVRYADAHADSILAALDRIETILAEIDALKGKEPPPQEAGERYQAVCGLLRELDEQGEQAALPAASRLLRGLAEDLLQLCQQSAAGEQRAWEKPEGPVSHPGYEDLPVIDKGDRQGNPLNTETLRKTAVLTRRVLCREHFIVLLSGIRPLVAPLLAVKLPDGTDVARTAQSIDELASAGLKRLKMSESPYAPIGESLGEEGTLKELLEGLRTWSRTRAEKALTDEERDKGVGFRTRLEHREQWLKDPGRAQRRDP